MDRPHARALDKKKGTIMPTSTKIRTVAPMAPKPHVVALDNPHGTNWRVVATGLATTEFDREHGYSVWVTFQCDQGWRCDYGYRHEGENRGWSLWAN